MKWDLKCKEEKLETTQTKIEGIRERIFTRKIDVSQT